jgi:2-polyprenyl-6-methoxyphenol hydroxylase-like FAD-dependent oxidoreductase
MKKWKAAARASSSVASRLGRVGPHPRSSGVSLSSSVGRGCSQAFRSNSADQHRSIASSAINGDNAGSGNSGVTSKPSTAAVPTPTISIHYPVCITGGGPVGLLMSILLTDMGVNHCLIEKKTAATAHPQAHFINNRTMEIFQSHCNKVFQAIIRSSPPSDNWRDFVYGYSVLGRQFARVDHFSPEVTDPAYFNMSSTSCVHLPQNALEAILRDEVARVSQKYVGTSFFGYKATDFDFSGPTIQLNARRNSSGSSSSSIKSGVGGSASNIIITTDLLIAADGAHSEIRKLAGVGMTGQHGMQVLLNVQFKCDGLSKHLKPRPAMLYFVFNEVLDDLVL